MVSKNFSLNGISNSVQLGKNGVFLHTGNNIPTNSFGNNGDVFILNTGELYQKKQNNWSYFFTNSSKKFFLCSF
jgi:hypothetical protein